MRNSTVNLCGIVLAAAATIGASRPAAAMPGQPVCDDWHSGPLVSQSEGINGIVECMTVWTPPGGVPLLVVGGNFTTAGGVPANCIAAWDGASWKALGGGTSGPVYSLTVYNGQLIAGGFFAEAGGIQCNSIARYDGSAWHALGGGLLESPFGALCHALTVYNGELIAAGDFSTASNSPGPQPFLIVNNIARWNGSTWNTVAGAAQPGVNGSVPENVEVKALAVVNNMLYAGGNFQTAGGIPVSNIARWDGNLWGTLGGLGAGVNNYVQELSQFNGELVVAGEFNMAGPSGSQFSAPSIARFNPNTSSWGAYGSGITGAAVYALQNLNGGILAGGWSHSGGPNLAFWNGATWSLFNGGASGPSTPYFLQVAALSVYNGNVIVGGWFNRLGLPQGPAADVTNIGQWTGPVTAWQRLWAPPAQLRAMTTMGGRVIAAGSFTQSTTNTTPAHNIVSWNGVSLSPVRVGVGEGEGTNGEVLCLVSYFLPGINGGNRLVAGGTFTAAGGVAANRVAIYSEPPFTPATWSPLGSGFNSFVWAVERYNNTTFAAGEFSASGATAVSRIAQFTGSPSAWNPLGTGMNGTVYALKSYGGFLYAGGAFTTAGGVSTGGLARWNGSTWSNVGGFFNGIVNSLAVHDGELVIGGQYPGINNSPNLAKYNGTFYSTLGVGGTDFPVYSITSANGSVYVGGFFTTAGGVSASRIARWNAINGWSEVRGGTSNAVLALTAYNGEVQVGGQFTAVRSGEVAAPGWARFSETGTPWIAQHPGFQTVNCGQSAIFTVAAASGYPGLTYLWHRNGVPLSNGSAGGGSIISGADTAQLTIANVSGQNAGAYTCVISNSCGSATSFEATLTANNCCQPDVNGSGAVDVDDLIAVILGWGTCPVPPATCPADVNHSGAVDVDDLIAVILGWGPCV